MDPHLRHGLSTSTASRTSTASQALALGMVGPAQLSEARQKRMSCYLAQCMKAAQDHDVMLSCFDAARIGKPGKELLVHFLKFANTTIVLPPAVLFSIPYRFGGRRGRFQDCLTPHF
eukprot:5832622-Amphidinium_carterae.1